MVFVSPKRKCLKISFSVMFCHGYIASVTWIRILVSDIHVYMCMYEKHSLVLAQSGCLLFKEQAWIHGHAFGISAFNLSVDSLPACAVFVILSFSHSSFFFFVLRIFCNHFFFPINKIITDIMKMRNISNFSMV